MEGMFISPGAGFGLSFGICDKQEFWDGAACLRSSESVWCRDTGEALLDAGWAKSTKASWSSVSRLASSEELCLTDPGSTLAFDMAMDRACLSLATGEGFLPPRPSRPVPWDGGEGLSLGVGTVRVGDTHGFGECMAGGGSLNCEAGRRRKSLGFGFLRVGEEFVFGGGQTETLGFVERAGELCVLGLVLGSVEALSPWVPRVLGLLQVGWLDVLEGQIGRKDLQPWKKSVN